MDNLQSFHKFLTPYSASRLKLEAMKLLRPIITIVCIVASSMANGGEPLTPTAKDAVNQSTAADLQLLQGTWEGVEVGDKGRLPAPVGVVHNLV